MIANSAVNAARLFRGFVGAGKSFDWRPSTDEGIIHSGAKNEVSREMWDATKTKAMRIQSPSGSIFHLQIRLERLHTGSRHRVIIFGRRMTSWVQPTPNTQRATFNSDHINESGYWLRPQLKKSAAVVIADRLRGSAFPRLDGKHIKLGTGSHYVVLRRFLIALAVIEDAKGVSGSQPLPFGSDPADDSVLFETDDLHLLAEIEEGRIKRATVNQRHRCARLLGEAQEHFRSLTKDGRLRCTICMWAPTLKTRSHIVQVHHLKQLRKHPREGVRMTLAQALQNLAPLCPNCHRVLESHPDGGLYTIEELRQARRHKPSHMTR